MKPMFAFACIFLVASCVSDSGSEVDTPTRTVADDEIFTELKVVLGPDGPVISAPRMITAGVERQQNEFRLHAEGVAAITQDYYCEDESLWIYDQPDWVGNRLCLSGIGSVLLTSLTRWTYFNGSWHPWGHWAISSGSFWPGEAAGNFTDLAPPLDDGDSGVGRALFFTNWGIPKNFNVSPRVMIYVSTH